MLLEDVRGQYKMPGEYRTSQNWIGGASIADARYIPPHHSLLNDLMGDLENFINNESQMPDLIKIAIIHYQFETIHPFLDGNGRIGRLLITLYLVSKGILDKPLLYLSAFFEKNKSLYYQNLADVKERGAMVQWIKFFLVGVQQTSCEAVDTLSKVLKFKEETENQIRDTFGRRASNAVILFHNLLKRPTTSIEQVMGKCNLSYKSANDLVKDFVKIDILEETTGQSRNRFFRMKPYLEIFRG
jgi:Fic family protein